MKRPQISVYSLDGDKVESTIGMPDVFVSPIRMDIVNKVHTQMRKNKLQPHSININAGMTHSAESWGTGRAVARIPRISGSGTSRAGQGAFGNQCRKGRMFAPIRIWRKWGRKIPTSLKRYSVISSVAASAVTPLVMSRGHRISKIKELPLVVSNQLESIKTTKEARKFLKVIGAEEDRKQAEKKRHRPGRGKMRTRPYLRKRGPLIVYLNNNGIGQAFRNIIGVDTMCVKQMDVTKLAPGGHVGRFIIWTKNAVEYLNRFGSYDNKVGSSSFKRSSGLTYTLPRPVIQNSDVKRIMDSDSVQNSLNPRKYQIFPRTGRRGDQNQIEMDLNPYGYYEKRNEILKSMYMEKYGIQKKQKMEKRRVEKKD